MIDAIAREEFDRIVERMNVPSGAYAFMVIIDQARLELMRGIPHHLCPAPPKGDQTLRSLVVHDKEAAAQVRVIFAGDGMDDEGRSLSMWAEHTWRASYGQWDWERAVR